MKVTKQTNEKGKPEIAIIVTPEDAELMQTALIQFSEKVANCKAHQSRMRRLAMLIDKKI